jgi:hypothetical protein
MNRDGQKISTPIFSAFCGRPVTHFIAKTTRSGEIELPLGAARFPHVLGSGDGFSHRLGRWQSRRGHLHWL